MAKQGPRSLRIATRCENSSERQLCKQTCLSLVLLGGGGKSKGLGPLKL